MYTVPLGNVLIIIVIMAPWIEHQVSPELHAKDLHAGACFDPRKSSEVRPALTLAVGHGGWLESLSYHHTAGDPKQIHESLGWTQGPSH